MRNIGEGLRAAALVLFSHDRAGADTEESRAHTRYRNAFWTALSTLAPRVLGVAVQVVAVPLSLAQLGPARYGLVLTISSLVGLLGFADAGVGNGLLNTLSECYGRQDMHRARRFISSGLLVLFGVAVVSLMAYAAVSRVVDWPSVLGIRELALRPDVGPALTVFVICWALAVPTGIAARVEVAFQRGFEANLWMAVGSAITLVGTIGAFALHMGVSGFVLAACGGPVAASLLNSLVFFKRSPTLRPTVGYYERATASALLRAGFFFFILQISGAVTYWIDNLLIARAIDATAVAAYGVVTRLFMIPQILIATTLTPLWPAYGEALARGDRRWVASALRRSLGTAAILSIGASALLFPLADFIVLRWTRGAILPPRGLVFALCAWLPLAVTGHALAMFLNGSGLIRFQVLLAAILAAVSVVAKIYAVKTYGTAGVAWATVASYVVVVALPMAFTVPRYLAAIRCERPLVDAWLPYSLDK
jgi:O-antigen/teichoic acid export membrane protein